MVARRKPRTMGTQHKARSQTMLEISIALATIVAAMTAGSLGERGRHWSQLALSVFAWLAIIAYGVVCEQNNAKHELVICTWDATASPPLACPKADGVRVTYRGQPVN